MKVSAIILNYNTPDLVYDCLDSISTHLTVPHEIIVVDNGSSKTVDPERVAGYANATYVKSERNMGFGGGNNLGAASATGDYLWFLNSDTVLPDGSANGMFSYLEAHPDVGAASPLLYNDLAATKFQEDSYASFQSLRTLILRNARPALDRSAEFFPVDMVVAAAFAVRRDIFEKIGGFDERIFMYMEDDDICYRIRQTGAEIGIHTASKVIHLQGKSVSSGKERKKLYYRSQDYFWNKHYGKAPALLMRGFRWLYLLAKGGR